MRYRVAGVVVLAALTAGFIAVCGGNSDPSSVGVVESMFETYGRDGPEAALRHFSAQQTEKFRDHMGGLTVLNDRLDVIEPCQEQPSLGTIVCVMSEQHDLHEAGGLPPVAVTFTFRVNEAGEISYLSQSVPDHYRDHYAFRSRFRIWLTDTHPEATPGIGGFPGVYQGPSPTFDAESAAAALDFIDEFVAQSPDYPPQTP